MGRSVSVSIDRSHVHHLRLSDEVLDMKVQSLFTSSIKTSPLQISQSVCIRDLHTQRVDRLLMMHGCPVLR